MTSMFDSRCPGANLVTRVFLPGFPRMRDMGRVHSKDLACPQLAEEHFADLNMSTKEKQFDILYVAFTLTMI